MKSYFEGIIVIYFFKNTYLWKYVISQFYLVFNSDYANLKEADPSFLVLWYLNFSYDAKLTQNILFYTTCLELDFVPNDIKLKAINYSSAAEKEKAWI